MSDPVEKLLDTFYGLKGEGLRVLSNTVDKVSDSETYQWVLSTVKKTASDPSSLYSQIPKRSPPPSTYDRMTDWISRHKVLVGAIALTATSGTAYYVYTQRRNSRPKKKRRARRAANNGRSDVVLIAGSPAEPITRMLAGDLDRRGFVVYWTTSSPEEEAIVKKEGSVDIRPLPITATESSSIDDALKAFDKVLNTPAVAFPGAEEYNLVLRGILMVPDLYFPAGPVESMRANTWSDLAYSKLLGPIFLLAGGLISLARRHDSRILLLTPEIMASLNPAFHAPECITASALNALALCLHRELLPQSIPFIHLRLGSFDIAPGRSSPTAHARQIATSIRADILSWPESIRMLYSQAYRSSAHLQTARTSGSSLRTLNNAVFDALTVDNPKRVWYVGRGSYAYRWLTAWVPEGVITWLLRPSQPQEKDWETV